MKQTTTTTAIELRSNSPEQTQRIAAVLAQHLQPRDVVALEGELGSGKTCFVRGLAHGLGIDGSLVSSPTFVIAHEYAGKSITLAHVDAYRLSGPADLETIGWSEMLLAEDAIVAVEWPQRIADALPRDYIDVRLQAVADTQRAIHIAVPSLLSDRLTGLQGERIPAAPIAQARCRTCGQEIDASIKTFPFCSERCRMADLGAWFREGYRVSRQVERDEENRE